jgi:hypothetical protein
MPWTVPSRWEIVSRCAPRAISVKSKRRSAAQAAGELACRPGSVHPLARAGGHPSRTAVAGSLMRSTREHRAGRPQSLAQELPLPGRSLLTLLRVGFTEPPRSPWALVVSYTTVSPLPPDKSGGGLFSVALSRGSPRVGVTDHPALRSPDLPRRASTADATRPPGQLARRSRQDRASAREDEAGGPSKTAGTARLHCELPTMSSVNQAAKQAAVLTVAPRRSGQCQR